MIHSEFKTKAQSNIELSQLMLPSHANFGGKVHGGFILKLMDEIAFACASKHSEQYCVTASVNTVNFLAPVEVGHLLTMKASVNFVGNTSMVVGIRVETQNIRDPKKAPIHCNSSYFTMVAKDDNGYKVKVPGLILETTEDVRRFSKSIERQKNQRERTIKFNEEDFASEEHLEQLKLFNVRVDL